MSKQNTDPDQIEAQLKAQRDCIDAADEKILALFSARIAAAKRIGEIKSALDQPAFYRPEREAQVLARLRELNARNPADTQLDPRVIESLFREIMSLTRASEAPLSVATLGPLGTYSEAAAVKHFGKSVQVVTCASIGEIFRSTETEQTNFAVVPVENSTEGGVNETLERLLTTTLSACGEINLRIQHHLLSNAAELSAVKRVVGHAQALAQCKHWLGANLPHAEQIPTRSNADAAHQAQQSVALAAIAGSHAAHRYQLKSLAQCIEDTPGNTTRFLVFSHRPTPPAGSDKTSLLLSCHHRPGALLHLLQPLLKHKIDMTRLESRPSRTGLWEYIFFIDIVGHQQTPAVADALRRIQSEAALYKNLGSYPTGS